MARSHATIKCSIWRDEEHNALSPAAKLVYRFVLEQGRLTLVGSLDLVAGRWGGLLGLSRERVEDAVAELADARFLVVDWATDEVLVRTFTHHDLDPNRLNVNLAKGLWGQWASIESRALRSVAVHEMPDAVWERLEPHAPDDAAQMRWSARLEPTEPSRLEPTVRTEMPSPVANLAFEPTATSHLPPVTTHRPAEAIPVPADFEHPPVPKIDPEQRLTNLAALDELRARRNGGDAA